MSPGDLFICGEYAILHELSHVLMFRQHGWSHSQLLTEGFAEYTTYLALKELQKTDPAYVVSLCTASSCISNMEMETEKMYEESLEYWFDNTFEHSANSNYSIGFRFMAYLNDVYGDYSKWVLKFNELYPFNEANVISDISATEQQIAVLKAAYGDNVLDGFYPWLKENTSLFVYTIASDQKDLADVDRIAWYPEFNAVNSRVILEDLVYDDLYINLEPLKYYLSEYKGYDVSDLMLTASESVSVNLYRADGSFTSISLKDRVSLEDISYIKLIGKGSLSSLSVVGFSKNTK